MPHAKFNITSGPGGRIMSVDSERVEECMRVFQEQAMAGIHISSLGAYKSDNVEFLREHPEVVTVFVSDGKGIDLHGLTYLTNLEHLTLGHYDAPIDLTCFPRLKTFSGEWSAGLGLGDACKSLRSLTLSKYKAPDLETFPCIRSISELELIQPSIASLAGIERHTHIKKLQFFRCLQLTSIGAIAGLKNGDVDYIAFRQCKKIMDIESLGELSRVKNLTLETCGAVRSLDFLLGCQKLEGVGFFETDVLDGDLSPLLQLPRLSFVGMSEKRHFSHTRLEINRLLNANREA